MSTTFDGYALELIEVSKDFGGTRAVDKLSMTVDPGTVLAFLGPNGAGKTTTIEMCEGFTRPTSGSIRVLGMDPATRPQQVRDRIGIMLQGGGSYSGITVSEMMRLAASYNSHPHDPDWLIDLVGLGGVKKTTFRRLSGGQQQRLSLALALIGRPELVFLDEPTAGMDSQSRHMVWDLISSLRNDGVTVILSTHLMDEAESLADKVVIIDHGHLVAQGSPAELTASDTHRLSFTTDRPLDLQAWTDGGRSGLSEVRDCAYLLDAAPSPSLVAAVADLAASQQVLIRSLDVSRRDLEDVFLDLTGRELRS